MNYEILWVVGVESFHSKEGIVIPSFLFLEESMADQQYDVVIIGGGPGGYIAGIRAGQLGLKTLVVEKDKLGGICLNWGCIPTKALLKNAEIYNLLHHIDDFGFSFDNLKADFSKAVKRSRDIAARSSKGIEFLFKKNKVDYLAGTAKIVSKNVVEVDADWQIRQN